MDLGCGNGLLVHLLAKEGVSDLLYSKSTLIIHPDRIYNQIYSNFIRNFLSSSFDVCFHPSLSRVSCFLARGERYRSEEKKYLGLLRSGNLSGGELIYFPNRISQCH